MPRPSFLLPGLLLTCLLFVAPVARAGTWSVTDPGQGPVDLPAGTTGANDLSGIAWVGGDQWLAIGDKDAIQYMSTTILKALADPQSTSGLRARGTNVRLAGDTARIFTTNAKSLEDWADGRFVITQPIRRKMFVFVITKKMIEDKRADRPDYIGSELV